MFRVVRMMILQQTLPSSSAAGAAVHHACQTSKVLKYNKRGDRLARKTPKNGRGGKHLGRHQTISPDHHRGSFAIEHRDGIPLPSPWICTNISFKDELNGEIDMAETYIVEAVRTAGGKRGGRLAGWHPADTASAVLESVVPRTRSGEGRAGRECVGTSTSRR